jgi:uncharacterized protein (TIGR03437 family)
LGFADNVYVGWLWPLLLIGLLRADSSTFILATAAGSVPASPLVQPTFVTYDADGTLYYASTHEVWRLNPEGTSSLIADGLSWVNGLATDTKHNVYISDLYAYEIRKVSPDGTSVRFGGTGGHPYYSAISSAGGPAKPTEVSLVPGPMVVDSTYVYVSDTGTATLVAFALDAQSSKVLAGNHGNQSSGDGGQGFYAGLYYPGALALANGSIYINEANGARIRQFVLRTGVITTAVQLTQTYLTDNGNPGLAADSDGSLYVQQGNSIFRNNQAWFTGDPTVKTASIAVNPKTHDVSFADTGGNLVQTVGALTGEAQAVAGNVHFGGDGGPAALAIFNGIDSVVADALGNVYVADAGNGRIRKIDTSGIVTTVASDLNLRHTPQFANLFAIDAAGNLFVSEYASGRIRKIDPSGIVSTVAGGGMSPPAKGVSATSAAILPGPIAIDSNGFLYFGNVQTNGPAMIPVIYKIDGNGQLVPYAGGQSTGSITEAGPAIATPIGYAYCLVADNAGALYVCDSAYARIRKITPDGMMRTIVNTGSVGPPTVLAVDQNGNLFVSAAQKLYQLDFTGSLQPFPAPVAKVTGMTIDAAGDLYFADGGNSLQVAMPSGSPVISQGGIIGAGASNPPLQTVAPGGIASIFGSNFSTAGPQLASLVAGKLPISVGGLCVSFGAVNAPIMGVFATQINVQVPDLPPGPVPVKVTTNCNGPQPVSGNVSGVVVGSASPEFYTSGGRVVANVTGGIVEAYGTGWGATTPSVPPGAIPGTAAPLAAAVALSVGGVAVPAANIAYAGISPCCAGLYQIDFSIPPGVPKGDQPLVITIDGKSSPASARLTIY